MPYCNDPIVALATPPGKSALAVIRLSGQGVIELVNSLFQGKNLLKQGSHTLHLGKILAEDASMVDEVIVALFRAPKSFTLEDSVEISCHGSSYIVQKIIHLLLQKGARLAKPGEFTQRAFRNGRFDLAQAEAVADLIAAESALAHRTALQQMRGGFSSKISELRKKLIHFGALLELELDFAEEDIEFANKPALENLLQELLVAIEKLIQSFALGNVLQEGFPIVIVGKPNVGKSTLLNALANEEKALVSDIPGTTRDIIEDTINIGGMKFRFVDTAGLRADSTDVIELAGIAKAKERMKQASLILYMFDLATESLGDISKASIEIEALQVPYIKVGNKLDVAKPAVLQALQDTDCVLIAAAKNHNLDQLQARILALAQIGKLAQLDTVVCNARHQDSLLKSKTVLEEVLNGLQDKLSNELLMVHIHQALEYLGEITGEISTEDILDDIFANFCIGK
jgi:tRNA modification GTPase